MPLEILIIDGVIFGIIGFFAGFRAYKKKG